MALTGKERQQLLALVIVAIVASTAGFWVYWRQPKIEQQNALSLEVDSLRRQVENARRDLEGGTMESLRQQTADYEETLGRMRELVPTGTNEVTQLIDDISSRAKRGGVAIGEFVPMTVEVGQSFDIHRYRWTVYGYYDAIGVLMSDIAQLPRIMVPYDVSLSVAQPADQRARGDTTGALIEAQFLLRTFVKPDLIAGSGGTGGTQ